MSKHHRSALAGYEPLAAVVALALLVVSVSQWWNVADVLPRVEAPAIGSEQAVRFVRLDVPPIGDFHHYYGRPGQDAWIDLNPFVPHHVRDAERKARVREREQRTRSNTQQTQTTRLPPPPAPPPVIEEVQPPQYPALEPGQVSRPEILGSMASGDFDLVFVRFSADGVIAPMLPGDEREGWTLVGIEGAEVIFRDADGVDLRLRIRSGDAAVTTLSIDRSGAPSGDGAAAPSTPGAGAAMATGPQGGPPRGRQGRPSMEQLEGMSSQQLIDMAQQDPRLREVIANPRVRQMIEDNPERAVRMLRRFAER